MESARRTYRSIGDAPRFNRMRANEFGASRLSCLSLSNRVSEIFFKTACSGLRLRHLSDESPDLIGHWMTGIEHLGRDNPPRLDYLTARLLKRRCACSAPWRPPALRGENPPRINSPRSAAR